MAGDALIRESLLQKANTLPLCPGVYVMRDRQGKVLYVGKSRKLKNRVSQYFQNSEKNIKTARMVAQVRDFDYYVCDNEMEALSLENALIKQHTPKYNIRLKDAKSYPYIKLTEGDYPRLVFTRQREQGKAKYFGPYSGSSTAYALIEWISRSLRLPTCSRVFPRDIGKGRPCIYYQMGRCMGVCNGGVSPEEYAVSIRHATDILSGRSAQVRHILEEEMQSLAMEERYEAAARCRDTIRALDAVREKQKVVADASAEHDVIGFYTDELCSCISVFYVRSGILQDKTDFLFGADGISEIEDVISFLCEHYRMREYIPPRILLSFSAQQEDLALFSAYLEARAGRKIAVRVPERGTLHTLCEMVDKNAAEQAKLYKINTERTEGTLARLAERIGLESYPQRIEAYDISNLGKEHLTAGMIVCIDGKFCKADYRSFSIRTVEGTDDYASMKEALSRRLAHLSDAEGSFSELPDLILLDGGRGHVATVKELLEEKGIAIPVFGMVKDEYHKTRALCTESEEISIAREHEVYSLIYRIQEEVHRFTVGRMENAKRKTVKTSSLTKIRGIGDAKAKKLLHAFGGMRGVKNASEEALAAVSGITASDARAIRQYFDGSADGQAMGGSEK
ncbi:MAG: excinuclease ABC subunit UvrC [Clostridia bacterium]|jgi:excinuclease ABC subunit C|nr:excinuclease ABC subunit UvrC [Clostridia bacterium]